MICEIRVTRPKHTSRFFCRRAADFLSGSIGLKFVGTSACRTLADFLSPLTAFRLGTESSKMAPTRRKLRERERAQYFIRAKSKGFIHEEDFFPISGGCETLEKILYERRVSKWLGNC